MSENPNPLIPVPDTSFVKPDHTLEEQVQIWREEYNKLYIQLLGERQEWEAERREGLVLLTDYRRDNKELENEKRKWESEKQFGFKLVENLRARVDHYQNKIETIEKIYKINIEELPDIASTTPGGNPTTTPGNDDLPSTEPQNIQNNNKSRDEVNLENPIVDDYTATQPTDDSDDIYRDSGDESESETPQPHENMKQLKEDDFGIPGLDPKAKEMLYRQRRESEYLRQECQVLEDELKAIQQEIDERATSEDNVPEEIIQTINEAWENEVARLLESIDDTSPNATTSTSTQKFTQWTPDDEANNNSNSNNNNNNESPNIDIAPLKFKIPDTELILSTMPSTPSIRDINTLKKEIMRLESDLEHAQRTKVELAERTAVEIENLRALLKSYNPNRKYRRLMDLYFNDRRYREIFDHLIEDPNNLPPNTLPPPNNLPPKVPPKP